MANTLTLARYGRYSAGAESDIGTVANGNSRASVYDPATQNIWVVQFAGIVGRSTGVSATFRWSSYDTDGSDNPRTRTGDSATATASTSYTGPPPGATIGALVTALVETSDNGPSNLGIMVFSGKSYAIDIVVRTATLAHSMRQASAITAINEQFYDRAGASSPPPSAYGSYVASIQGQQTQWMEGWVNVAPVTPASGLAPSGSVNTTTPTFTADFRDLNGSYGASSGSGVNTGDLLNQYHVQARQVGHTTLLWDQVYSAGPVQQAANQASIGYAGSALSRGTTYEWRIQQSDLFGELSNWSAWTQFTPANQGFVTLDSTPSPAPPSVHAISNAIPSANALLDFHGRWNHQSAATMTQAQMQLYDNNGVLVHTSGVIVPTGAPIASSALPGTLFTLLWSACGFTGVLAWGRTYQYTIRGYDGTQWSDYSAKRSFTTDAAPTIPSALSPPTGSPPNTNFPLLRFSMTDADDDHTGALTGVIRITRPDATTVDVTPTYNTFAVSAPWQFQTTATQLNQFGVYTWKAVGYDGTVYSGEATTLGAATFSGSNTFTYAAGPVPVISSPAANAVVTSVSIPVTWSLSSGGPQAKYQVIAYLSGTLTIAYDSTLITSSATTHTIPSGALHNGVGYDLVVIITNTTPLTGSSAATTISIAYPALNPIANPQVNPVQIGADRTPTGFRLSFDQTAYGTVDSPAFAGYNIYMWADGGPDASEVLLFELTSPTQTAVIYEMPASGYLYTFGFTVLTLTGSDIQESAMVTASASITLTSNVFTLVGAGTVYRANLLNVTQRKHVLTRSEQIYVPLGSAIAGAEIKPRTVRSRARYWTASYVGLLFADDVSAAQDKYDEFEALEADGGTVCWRDGRKKKRFQKITNVQIIDELPDYYTVSWDGRDEEYREGVLING